MIPEFDQYNGYLPPGVHKAQWKEVVQRFGTNEHRKLLLVGLRSALVRFAKAGCRSILLNGSFVTKKDKPGDYDAAWERDGVDENLLDPILLNWVSEREAMQDKYGGEFFPADLVEVHKDVPFREFFQTDEDNQPKGIVKIDPRELL